MNLLKDVLISLALGVGVLAPILLLASWGKGISRREVWLAIIVGACIVGPVLLTEIRYEPFPPSSQAASESGR